MTCDFAGVFGDYFFRESKNKTRAKAKAKAKAIDLSFRLRLHSGLRQSGRGGVGVWDAGLKPGSISGATARTTAKAKATARAEAIYRSLRPSGFAPAFGRVVASAAGWLLARLKPCP